MSSFDTFDIGASSPYDAKLQQPQGAPVSGLLAGILGMPTYSGAVPGAAYLGPSQGQPNGGQVSTLQPMSPFLSGILGVNQAGYGGAYPQTAQPPNTGLASAVGSGARSLLDGIMGNGR